MARKADLSSRRTRGHVRRRGNSFQVLVYAGTDPVTGRARYLTASTKDERQTDAIMRRLLTEVDEQVNVRTNATLQIRVRALDRERLLLGRERGLVLGCRVGIHGRYRRFRR